MASDPPARGPDRPRWCLPAQRFQLSAPPQAYKRYGEVRGHRSDERLLVHNQLWPSRSTAGRCECDSKRAGQHAWATIRGQTRCSRAGESQTCGRTLIGAPCGEIRNALERPPHSAQAVHQSAAYFRCGFCVRRERLAHGGAQLGARRVEKPRTAAEHSSRCAPFARAAACYPASSAPVEGARRAGSRALLSVCGTFRFRPRKQGTRTDSQRSCQANSLPSATQRRCFQGVSVCDVR